MDNWRRSIAGAYSLAMKTKHLRPIAIMLCIATCALFPTEARADAINFGFVAIAGIVVLVPLTLFTVLVEGIFLAIGLRCPYRRVLGVSLVANLVSLAAGIPVKIFNGWMYSRILPRPMAPYFRAYPWAMCLGSFIFFIVTLVTEYFVVAAWCRRRTLSVARSRLAAFVLLANTVTYAVLAPLHYVATRPTHDVRQFTDDSAWAFRPATEIYYVNGSGNLCSVTTDGKNGRVLLPEVVRDYQYVPATDVFLYRNGENNLCLAHRNAKPILCWRTDQRFAMEQVALSPDGRIVAYLKRVEKLTPYELILFDTESSRTVPTGIITTKDDYDPQIAWSESPDKLFLKSAGIVRAFRVGADLTAIPMEGVAGKAALAIVYGRFSTEQWAGGGDWGPGFSDDTDADTKAYAIQGLGSRLQVTKGGQSIVVADNPGFLKLGDRSFNDVSLLANGNELLFDDDHDIYIMDIEARKVGRVAEGAKFIMLTKRYLKDLWNGGLAK